MDFDTIRSSPKLRAHMLNFKHGITSFVDNLDDVECLTVLIHKMTENHFRRQITVNEFQVRPDTFLYFIHRTLTKQYVFFDNSLYTSHST
ncbi:hypothetical protein DPMN_018036 [Dreissena polymorpha]|uniref:Globin domain-containing protein n=1 Tax=Dreissena polymorpha TaxID=45954 RepID=A0A9D4NI09_DREPO|nr:hypothetical protein DPMN_018036 [Dreissena polymorpha]